MTSSISTFHSTEFSDPTITLQAAIATRLDPAATAARGVAGRQGGKAGTLGRYRRTAGTQGGGVMRQTIDCLAPLWAPVVGVLLCWPGGEGEQ